MGQSKIRSVTLSLAMASFLWGAGPAFSHGDEHAQRPKENRPLGEAIASPAYRIYDAVMTACMEEALGVNPVEAARAGNKSALRMDRKDFLRIEDCMRKRGIDVDFANHYSSRGSSGLDPTIAAEVQSVQEKLNIGAGEATEASASGTPVSQKPVAVPKETGPGKTEAGRNRGFWVKPE